MYRIKSLPEFLPFLPHLAKLHPNLDSRWEIGLTPGVFCDRLMNRFTSLDRFYGEIVDHTVVYFVVVCRINDEQCFFWTFYINPECRDQSKMLMQSLMDELRDEGYRDIFFSSSNLNSSYKRWVLKFGAVPISSTFKLIL